MWWLNGTREQDRLNSYWDAVVSGASPEAPAQAATNLDPNYTEAIAQVRALHRRHRPDPAFALHLETTLMNAFATTYPKSTVLQPAQPKRLVTRPTWLPRREVYLPRRWSLAAVATVALIAITIAIFFFNLRDTNQPAILPGTPDAATPTVVPATDEPVSMYRGGPGRTGVLPGPSLTGAPVGLWKLQTGEPVNLGAAVVDGVLYLPAGSQGFEARDAMTGDLIWAFPTDAAAVSAPAVVDGLGYVIDADGTLYAVRTGDGSEAWRMANLNVRSSVAPVDGLVYAVSPEGTLYALEAATGAVTWQADTGAEAAGGMAVVDGIVYQGNAAGVMSAFDAKTGELRWTFQNEEVRGNATVTVANGQIYITISGGDTNAMYAVDAANGELTWRQEQGQGQGFISTTATPTRLYSVAEDGLLHALDAETGETVWTYQLVEFVRSIPVLVDDTLYVADNGGFVRAIDPLNGDPLWQYSIAGEVDLGWPVVSDGVLYIGTSFGNLYAITGSDMIAAPSIMTPTPFATPVPAGGGALPATPPSGTTGEARIVWESNDANAELSHAAGLAAAPDGTIWVADGANSRFQIFDPDGNLIEVWGQKGSGEGQFNFVRPTNGDGLGGVAFAPDGTFYVVDTGNVRIQHFSADGEFLAAWGSFGTNNGQFVSPSSIGVDSQGNVLVSDDLREDVQKFDASGTWLATIGRSGSGPGELDYQGYLTIGPDDTIWVADPENGRIHHFANDGTLIADLDFAAIPEEPRWVQSLTVDAEGRLYLADIDGKRLFVLGSDGTLLGIWSLLRSDGSANPNSGALEVTADGSVYLTDWLNGTLYRYELDPPVDAAAPLGFTTTFLWQAGGADSALTRPDGIAAAPDGSTLVIDAVDHEVHVFEPDGTTRQVIMLEDAGAGSFVFTLPNGESYASISVDADGNAYVLDTGHFRVVKFDANGQFVQEFSYRDQAGNTPHADDIVVGPDGSVYVKDNRTASVLRFTAAGDLAAVIGQPENVDERLVGPAPIGVDAEGNVYVGDNAGDIAEVKVYAPDGMFLRHFGNGDLELAIDVAVDANGNVYVTDPPANQIKVFDRHGELIGAIGEAGTEPGQFTGIGYVAVDANGNLYVVDFEARQLEAFHLTWTSPAEAAASPAASPVAVADQVTLLWQTTGGPTPLDRTFNPRIAPDGNVWVPDGGHSQFQIFSPDGTFLEAWGTPGSGDGQFNFTRPNSNGDSFGAVAFAPDGSFYVADTGNHRIQHFAADRTFLHAWGSFGGEDGQFSSPVDLAVDADGLVYVGDDRREDLQVFAADGTFLRVFGGGADPEFQGWITLGPDDTIWGADGGKYLLHQWRSDGTLLRTIEVALSDGTPVIVGDVEFDAAGNLLVPDGDNGRLLLLDPNGVLLAEWEVAHVGGMTPAGAGAYYTTDYGAGLLLKYQVPLQSAETSESATPDAVELLWETTGGDGGLDNPSTLTIAPDGTIWVADAGNARFQIFDTDGTFIESWTGTGDGRFSLVDNNGDQVGAVAFAPDGSFYVLDPGARQVLVFSADRTFVRSIGEPGMGPGQFFKPYAIDTDLTGNVAVLDDARGDIQIFAPDGTLVATVLPQSTYDVPLSVNLMTVDGDGNIYIVEAYYDELSLAPVVGKYDPEGNLLQQFGDASGPGSFGRTQGGEFNDQPVGVTVDADGNVYVTEIGTNPRIVVFSAEGDFLMEFGGAGSSTIAFDFPLDVAADGQGNIYVTDLFQNRLVKLRLPESLFPATPTP